MSDDELPECDRCKRPAKRRPLYFRRNGVATKLGDYGRACFYVVAAGVVQQGAQPEHENARVIYLRGRS